MATCTFTAPDATIALGDGGTAIVLRAGGEIRVNGMPCTPSATVATTKTIGVTGEVSTDATTYPGRNGDNLVRGGKGGDRLDGGRGDNLVQGGHGRDQLNGGAGDDVCRGSRGPDSFVNCENHPTRN